MLFVDLQDYRDYAGKQLKVPISRGVGKIRAPNMRLKSQLASSSLYFYDPFLPTLC